MAFNNKALPTVSIIFIIGFTVSAIISYWQYEAKQKGFLAFLPLYQEDGQSGAMNPNNLTGFVLGVYRIGDIFNYLNTDADQPTIHMQLVDETDTPDILTQNRPTSDNPVIVDIQYKRELPEIWGRNWTIVASPTQQLMVSKRDYFAETLFAIGLMPEMEGNALAAKLSTLCPDPSSE